MSRAGATAARALAAVAWVALAGAASVTLGAAAGRAHPAMDSLGVWLLYGLAASIGLAALFAALRRPIAAAAALLVAAGGAAQVLPYAISPGAEPSTGLRFLQHNLNHRNAAQDLAGRIGTMDVVTLQEVRTAAPAVAALDPAWHVRSCRFASVGEPAVLTRLPVEASGCLEGGAWIRARTPDGPVTFVSLHLHWPWPYGQPGQVARLVPALEALPRPVVLAGDFNQTPWSDSVARVAAATGTAPLPGLGATLVLAGGLARLDIDHVLVPADWTGAVVRDGRHGSDHEALAARIGRR